MQIGDNKCKMMFVLRSLKMHGKNTAPHLIKISSSNHTSNKAESKRRLKQSMQLPCPYQLIHVYIAIRGPFYSESDQFFIFADGSQVSPNHVCQCLKTALINLGFNARLYSLHSLRAGRASDMAKLGVPVETIKRVGQWRSNAVFKYLKYA